jgi:hypothetical protein
MSSTQIADICIARDRSMDQAKSHFLDSQKTQGSNPEAKQRHLIMATACLGDVGVQQNKLRQLINSIENVADETDFQQSKVNRLLHLAEVLSEANPTEDLVKTMTEFYCLSKNLPSAYVVADNFETDVYVDTLTEVVVKDD